MSTPFMVLYLTKQYIIILPRIFMVFTIHRTVKITQVACTTYIPVFFFIMNTPVNKPVVMIQVWVCNRKVTNLAFK